MLSKKASASRMKRAMKPLQGSALRNRSRLAFSLIEVMIALGVVMFAVVPMVALLPVAQKTYSDSKRATIYANIMQQLNDEANLANFSTVANLATTHYYDDQGVEITTGSTADWRYKAVITVSNPNSEWTHFSNTPYPSSLATYSANTCLMQVTLNDHANINSPTTNNIVLFNQGL